MNVMGNTFYFEWEVRFMTWLQSFADKAFVRAASIFTMIGGELVAVGILGLLYWCFSKELGKKFGMNLLLGLLTGSFLKNIFCRRRPYFDHPEIQCLKPVNANEGLFDINAQGFSFPSMHSMNSVITFGMLSRISRRPFLKVLAGTIPVLVGISRVMLGVHYPTDVLAGWMIGLVSLFVGTILQERQLDDLKLGMILLFVFLPGWFFCTSDDFYTAYGLTAGFMSAFTFEEKKVRFAMPERPLYGILRLAGGLCVFVAVCEGLRFLFPEGIIHGEDTAAHAVISFRYAAASFISIGVYPLVFRLESRKSGSTIHDSQ